MPKTDATEKQLDFAHYRIESKYWDDGPENYYVTSVDCGEANKPITIDGVDYRGTKADIPIPLPQVDESNTVAELMAEVRRIWNCPEDYDFKAFKQRLGSLIATIGQYKATFQSAIEDGKDRDEAYLAVSDLVDNLTIAKQPSQRTSVKKKATAHDQLEAKAAKLGKTAEQIIAEYEVMLEKWLVSE